MLSVEGSLLLMTVIFNTGVAAFILHGNWRQPVNVLFGAFLIALSLWGAALIGYGASTTAAAAILFGKIAYIAALLLAGSFYLFSLSFPDDRWPQRGHLFTVIGIVLACCAALLLPRFLVVGVVLAPSGNDVILYPFGYGCFVAAFDVLFLGGLARTWRKWWLTPEPTRTQLLLISASVTVAGIGGMFFNLLLASPLVRNFDYLWTGPLFTTVIAVAIMYAVFRFRLFHAKVIVAELLITLLWTFTLLQAVVSTDAHERLLNGGLLAVSVIIGTLLIKSVRAEVRAGEALSEFMSFASHELRNPITGIRGYASNVLEDDAENVPTTTRNAVLKIKTESEIVLGLISQYLDKSKLELGQIEYDLRPTDCVALVKSIIGDLEPRAREKGLALALRVNPGTPLVRADQGRLRESASNLIDNAIKYTRQGQVDVSIERRNASVRITVSDTGMGIPKETLRSLFQKFSRADAERLNLQGSGLGLYLAKTFVEGMGGRIWAESDGIGKGSRFTIELQEA